MNRLGTNGRAKRGGVKTSIPDECLLSTPESFVELGHGQKPPKVPVQLFGRPKFTSEDQAKNPDQPMTRVVKDVLRVGTWRTGWDKESKLPTFNYFTPTDLKMIEASFREGQRIGEASNLGKTHGIERALREIEEQIKDLPEAEKRKRRKELRDALVREDALIHPDDILQPISNTVFDGKTLWIESYVTPEQAKYLTTNNGRKVSVGLKRNYQSGNGAVLPVWMKHVAITDRPVVTGQGNWVAMANENDFAGDPDTDEESDDLPDEEEGTVPFPVVIDRFNRALDLLGMPGMPNTVTPETFPDVSDALLKTKEPQPEEIEEDRVTNEPAYDVDHRMPDPTLMANQEPANMADDKKTQQDAAAALGELIVSLKTSVDALSARMDKYDEGMTTMSNIRTELDSVKAEIAGQRNGTSKTAYMAKLTAGAEQRGVAAKTVDRYTKLGEETDWNLSNLDFIDDMPIKGKPKSRDGIQQTSEKGEKTAEEIKALANQLVPA